MSKVILTKWKDAVGKKRYSERHFLAQKPEIAEELVVSLQKDGLHTEDIAEKVEDYVFSSALTREEACASLFLLRDACTSLLSERPLLPRIPMEKVVANLERFIPKLAIKLENSTNRSDQDTGFALTRFDPGETALELDSNFTVIALRTGLPLQFGYSPTELKGMPFKQLFSAPSHSLLRFAESQFEEEKRMTVSLDLEAINKAGGFFPVSVQIRRFTEASRNGYDVLMQPHDHTQEARNVLNLVTMALESVGEGILITEPLMNGRILFINGAMERLSGINSSNVQTNSESILSGNFSPGMQQDIFQSAIENGWEGEMELLQPDGSKIPVLVHKHPIRTGNNELVAIVSVVRNLQRRKAHEAKIQQQNKRLHFLQQLSQILGNSLDLMKTLDGFADHLHKLFDHKGVDILLPLEDSGQFFRLFYTSNDQQNPILRKELYSIGNLPFFQSIASAEDQIFSLTAENYPKDPYFRWLKLNNIRHLVYLPIIFTGKLIGIVILRFEDCLPFKREDIDFLSQVIGQLTIAFNNFIHLDQIQKTNIKLQLISNLFSHARTNQSIKSILSGTAAEIAKAFGYTKLALYRERKPGEWRLISAYIGKGSTYPTNLIAVNEVTFPGIWLDCFSQQPFEVFFKNQLAEQQARFALWLTEKSSFRGKIAMLGISESYLTDLSYTFHTEIAHALLKELTLAIDHITLFQQTAIAEQEWQTTFDEVQIGLAVVDQKLMIQRANRSFWQMFRQAKRIPTGPIHCRDVMLSSKDQELPEAYSPQYWQTPVEWFDKSLNKTFFRRYFPLPLSGKGIQGGIFIVEDVSESRSKERHIRYLSRFPEINPNLVLSLLKNGEVRYFNNATRKALRDLEFPENQPRHLIPVSLLFELENKKFTPLKEHEYMQEIKDRIFRFTAFMPEGDDQIYLYGMEITEQLDMQKRLIQTERMRATGEMATGIAHDFNNLLTTIIGRVQLTDLNLSQGNEVDVNEQLRIIEKAALDGAQIVKRLQELNRRNRRRIFKDIYLNQLIEDSLMFSTQKIKLNEQVRGQKTQIHRDFEKDLVVRGNPIELKEVFTNLIFNAFDAMPDGGDLYLRTLSRPDGMLEISVRDTGLGMSKSTSQKIFDPFFTTKGERGTGIGLSLAYNIITAHKGRIVVDSKPGKGTTFRVWLQKSDSLPKKETVQQQPKLNRMSSLSLLAVDDEPELLETIRDILNLKFKQVDVAVSGEEALEMAQNHPYDVILTDLGMPGMSGWEVAREMKQLNDQCRVILVTGWGLQARDEMHNHKYVDNIISKPYDVKNLLNMLEAFTGSPQGMPMLEAAGHKSGEV